MQTIYDHESPQFYKRQVAQRFDRAATTYDVYGQFQQLVLDYLAKTIPVEQADSVLDLGTGTGRALPLLSSILSPELLLAVDLSSQMLAQARSASQKEPQITVPDSAFVCADAESLPFCDESFALVFSSLALQWCLHPKVLFDGLLRVLKPGGHLVFATLCQGSMAEVNQAWQGVDDEPRINRYAALDVLLNQLSVSSFCTASARLESMTMFFESPEKAMHSINKVGAGLVADARQPISPSRWKAFLKQYERQRTNAGIPLSYQVAFVIAQKPF